MNLWRITFTGLDESCQPRDILDLWRRERRLEFGILFSDTRAGEGRYPSHRWIESIAAELRQVGATLALHICGGARRRFLTDGRLKGFNALAHFDRAQLNGTFTEEQAVQLQRVLEASSDTMPALITQHDATPALAERLQFENHQVLFDASGGNGIAREVWPAPIPGKACGYAGGLGPTTLERELPRIAQAAGETPFWVDMENRLRTEGDVFSLDAAHRVLDVVAQLSPRRAGAR